MMVLESDCCKKQILFRILQLKLAVVSQCHWHFVPTFTTVVVLRILISLLCFQFLWGSGVGPKKHLDNTVLFNPYCWSLLITLSLYVAFFFILSICLTAIQKRYRRCPKVPLVFFYLVFYLLTVFILCLPIADMIFNITSGEKLTPSTIKAYISSGSGGNPFAVIIDSILVSKTLVPKVYTKMSSVILWSFAIVGVSQLVTIVVRNKVSSKMITFILISFYLFGVVSVLFLISPFSRHYTSSFDPIITSTKNPDLFFFFKPPVYPRHQGIEDVKLLRELFPLPTDEYWLSDEYPLVHGPIEKYCQFHSSDMKCKDPVHETKYLKPNEYPDIFVVGWESLSGNIVSLSPNNEFNDTTPNFDELIQNHGVFYQNLVSNGCPTSNAFWSFINMAWPLSHGNTIIDTLGKEFDSIYHVIKRSPAKYTTAFITASSPKYSRLIDWLRKADVDNVKWKYRNHDSAGTQEIAMGNRFTKIWNNDRILIEQFKTQLNSIDKVSKGTTPVFNWLMSISTHAPFTTFDLPENVGSEIPKGALNRYIRATKYADEHLIKNLVEFLKTRSRSNNTVLIVMGDHAAYKSGLHSECSHCPDQPFDGDQTFYTTAALVFFGSEKDRKKLGIPPPGTIDLRPTSTLDLADTIIQLSGARTATHTLGRSLLKKNYPEEHRHSLSLISLGAELNSRDTITRIDWSGTSSVTMKQSHPSFTPENILPTQKETVKKIIRLNNLYNHLVSIDAIWHTDFALDVSEFPKVDLPLAKDTTEQAPFGFYLMFIVIVFFFFVSFVFNLSKKNVKRKFLLEDEMVDLVEVKVDL
ncbi:hypothetical protein GEMRC1_011199 [Eukaryota sp. GEM-RC1]